MVAQALPLPIDPSIIRAINCVNGDLRDSLRRAPWWANANHVEAVRDLEAHLSRHYAQGYRHFMLILPAGYPQGQHLMPSSQWGPMDPERRDALTEMLPRWKREHPDTVVYVYAGFNLADPTSLAMPSSTQVRLGLKTPDITRDWAWFQSNWRQWIEDCGIDGVAFDYSATPQNRAAFVEVARVLSISGIRCMGEAIPYRTYFWGRTKYPAPEAYQASWMILENYLARIDPKKRWRFDPKRTQIYVGFRQPKPVKEFREYLRRGFKIINYVSGNDETALAAMAIYNGTPPATDADADTGDAG